MGNAATFAELIANPHSEKVFLCEAKPGELLVSDAFASWAEGFLSLYPPEYTSDYANATSNLAGDSWPNPDVTYVPYNAINPAKSLTGSAAYDSWLSAFFGEDNQSFHIKLPVAAAVGRIYYENYHNSGANTNYGAKNFTFWGSNSEADFLDRAYAHDGTWVNLTAGLSASQLDEHAAADAADPKYITSSNTTDYLYYRFKFADNWGYAVNMGVRRIELQVEVTSTYRLPYSDETITLADGTTETIKRTIAACEVDGVALTAQASISTVEADEGSYWQDAANSLFYIHVPGDGDPKNNTVIVYFWVYFATKGISLDSEQSGDYGSVYPPVQSADYVKATTENSATYKAYLATDPSKSLTGESAGASWATPEGVIVNQRINIDLGARKFINGFYYENFHHFGAVTNYGIKYFTLWGSNIESSFMDTTYANDTGWTQIATSQAYFDQHAASDAADPKFISATNETPFRYLSYKFADNWGNEDYMGVRRIEPQTNQQYRYYEPYIAENGIPLLSQESQSIHWGASQISSGSVVLSNGRGYFDQIAKRWIWNNKSIKLLLGGDALPYSEYTSIFAGRILSSTFTKADFTLDIESAAFALLRSLPINNFWTSTWANLDPAAEGKPIPYYWGSYSAAQAPIVTCINTAYGTNQYQFKICDCAFHAIKSITQVYIDYGAGAGWQTVSHANEDLVNGTFTITAASFVLGASRVKVAFEGYHSGGTLIDGAPEFVEDLLQNQCGYAAGDLNAASFTASKAISECALNVAIDREISALSVIETACRSDLAFFDEDGSGLLRYRTWEPEVESSVPILAKEDILETPVIEDDTTQLFWKTKVGYSRLNDTGEYLYTEASHSESKYKYGRDDSLTIETYLRSKSDADQLAGRLNWITRNPSPIISLPLKAGQINKTLGDKLKVTLARAPHATAGGYVERAFEIVSKEISCFPLFVTLRARDTAEFGRNVGFWMADTAPAWATATDAEKEISGFWTDADGFVDSSESDSKNKLLWW